MSKNQIDHDRMFKELLETFFAEFMKLFFIEASQAIDFSHIRFMQQEIFTDVTAGEKHEVDILVETRLKEDPGLILIHVEPQAYVQRNFNQRMFVYFSRLFEKYQRKILPIVVFSYDQTRDEPDRFELGFPLLPVLSFNFYKLELRKLHWREYMYSDNPIAAALLSKMGFSPEEKVQVKIEFMRMLARMKLDPARMVLLGGFFETYLKLNHLEEEEYCRELDKLDRKEADTIMQITTSWHEKGWAEGQVHLVLRQLKKLLGEVPADVEEKIKAMGAEKLEQLGEALLDIKTIDELKPLIH